MKIVKEFYYSEDHEWVKVEEGMAFIGLTDHAQSKLGEIVYVELPEVDDQLGKGDSFGVVESVKTASDCYMPISGDIIEINEKLEDSPEFVNEDPFNNWLIKVEIKDKSEIDDLMNAESYEKFCDEEE